MNNASLFLKQSFFCVHLWLLNQRIHWDGVTSEREDSVWPFCHNLSSDGGKCCLMIWWTSVIEWSKDFLLNICLEITRVWFWAGYLSTLGNKEESDFLLCQCLWFFECSFLLRFSFRLSIAMREVKIAREAEVAVHGIATDVHLNLCAWYFLLRRHFRRAGASKRETACMEFGNL